MDEVRSYWQVASITHFCSSFGKPFKLPTFEPEELEQAFIINVPEPPKSANNNNSNNYNSIQINDHNSFNQNKESYDDSNHRESSNPLDGDHIEEDCSNKKVDQEEEPKLREAAASPREDPSPEPPSNDTNDDHDDPEFKPPSSLTRQPQAQPQPEEPPQQELHLLVKLGIALLKPHFNTKISPQNWENYLRRIVDANWVDLEHYPSPFQVPIISQEGVESTKNLTFNELPLGDKIDLFYALCDYRFWCEDASEAIKDYTVEELRLESIGKDSQGYEYWYFSGTRLYREDKELLQDIILKEKHRKELEYKLIELERARIVKEQEEKRKAELERAKQLANEAKEARLAAKRQQEQETNNRKRRNNTPILPPRTGLRERRSSAASNSNDSQPTRAPTTRSKLAKQVTPEQPRQAAQKTTRSSSKNSRQNVQQEQRVESPDLPKKSSEEECKEELERLAIKPEERSAAWCIHCESLEEWEAFATKFEKTKSTNEKYLSAYVNDELLPKIRAIYAKRAAEVRRKEKELLLSLASRRVSTRIISKRAQEEEEERRAQERQIEIQKQKAEAEQRLRAELEREMRAKRNRFVVNGVQNTTSEDQIEETTNGRYNLRQHDCLDDSNEFDGIIHPDKLSDFYEALELVIDTVRTSKHAWPFVDPVPETVPGYYDLIEEPMDLKNLRTKVEFREYKSLIEVEKDFQLLVNNCEKFNGPKNVYTKMVYKLWKTFRKNVRIFLERDLHMDEYETFIYPPPRPADPVPIAEQSDPAQNGISDQEHASNDDRHEETAQNNGTTGGGFESNHKVVVETKIETTDNGANLKNGNETVPMEVNNDQTSVLATKTPIELGLNHVKTPEPIIGEDIIIDSYDVAIPDDNFFIWPQDAKPLDAKQEEQ